MMIDKVEARIDVFIVDELYFHYGLHYKVIKYQDQRFIIESEQGINCMFSMEEFKTLFKIVYD